MISLLSFFLARPLDVSLICSKYAEAAVRIAEKVGLRIKT